jgi:hypothetical protein
MQLGWEQKKIMVGHRWKSVNCKKWIVRNRFNIIVRYNYFNIYLAIYRSIAGF